MAARLDRHATEVEMGKLRILGVVALYAAIAFLLGYVIYVFKAI